MRTSLAHNLTNLNPLPHTHFKNSFSNSGYMTLADKYGGTFFNSL